MEERKKSYIVTSVITFVLAVVLVVVALLGILGVVFNLDPAYTLDAAGLFSFDWVTTLDANLNAFAWVVVVLAGVCVVALLVYLVAALIKRNKKTLVSSLLVVASTLLLVWVFALYGNVNVVSLGTLPEYAIGAITFDSAVVDDVLVNVYFILVAVLTVVTFVATVFTYVCLFLSGSTVEVVETVETVEVKEKPKRKVVLSIKRHPHFVVNPADFGYEPKGPAPDGFHPHPHLSLDDIRAVVREELKGKPTSSTTTVVYENSEASVTKDNLRKIVHEELKEIIALLKLKKKEQVVVKEVIKEVAVPVVEEKVEEPAPDKTVEVHVTTPDETPAPVVHVQTESEEAEPTKKVERITFSQRMVEADDDIREHYNNLKSLLKSYGLNNRVANGGDTFRLHRVTYCKITIAGKALKLYLALDPQDYANTTLPIKDSSSKAAYKDIPLTFKVKSELSYRRAEQLIRDCMEKHDVEQIDQVYVTDWASKVEEEANLTGDSNDEE